MGVKLDQLENVLSEKRLSQADIARRAGLSEHTIGRAVRDKEPLSEASAKRIAGALGVRVGSLQRNPAAYANTDLEFRHLDSWRTKEAMTSKGMNPTELAARTGLSVSTVSSARKGDRQPRKQTVEKIARALGRDITRCHSEPAEPRAASIEVRAKAGQKSTILYPEEGLETGPADDRNRPSMVDQESGVKSLSAVPAVVGTADVEETSEDQQQGRGTLDEIYYHVQQSRRMVSALLEHVWTIEEQIGKAVAASAEGQNGRG